MNPLFDQMTRPNNNSVKMMLDAVRMAQNPFQALSQASQNNPMLSNIIQMCQGKDPKDVFYSECKRLGVNPDDILNQLK